MLKSSKFLQSLSSSTSRLSPLRCVSNQTSDEWDNAKPYEEIPGPKNSFQLLRLMGPGGKYQNLSLIDMVKSFRDDFGPLARFPGFLGMKPVVMTFLPEDIELIHRTEGKFPRRRVLDSIEYFRKTARPDLYPAGAGLTITQGQEWYDFRTKVQQILMQPRTTKKYIPGIDEVSSDFIKKIRKIRDNKNEMPADFWETVNEWALESISLIALDTRLGVITMSDPSASKMNKNIKRIFQVTFDYDIQPSIWRYFKTPGFRKVLKLYEDTAIDIKKYILEAVERYEKNPSPDDQESGVLEKLIKIDKNVGMAMAEDMLLAGVDTTSAAFVGVLYNLAANPDKQEILRKEVLKILPEKDSKLSATSFNNMPYLRAVIKESLRMNPVVNGNMRAAGQDLVLQGYRIPKGTDVMLPNSLAMLNQFEQEDKFIPERWLKTNEDPKCPNAKDVHPFAYLPFGFGSRMCIGRRFAELEVEVLTCRMVREFNIEWPHPDLKFKSITINLPDGPLKFKLSDI